jgi:4-methyl-5(b-hydroxyethyl)-thiazole monophosphate biosynthesis
MASAAVLLAEGFEEIEAVTIIDVLRRAGVEVTTLGTGSLSVTGSHGIAIEADALLVQGTDQPWDMVVLPGGMPGAAHLRDDENVQALLRRTVDRDGHIAAICAAPMALGQAGLLEGRKATSYPTFEDKLGPAVDYQDAEVVVDGKLITSRGPGTSLRFALSLVELLVDEDTAATLAEQMLVTP